MRQIILDTETTGLNPKLGHRIVEVACLELFNGVETGRVFHSYINPVMPMPPVAQEIHGLNDEFLSGKPTFERIIENMLEFIRDAELVIHNAPFDIGFLNYEFALAGKEAVSHYCPSVIDTLRMAKLVRPGKSNSLDVLCQDYGVDNSSRALHSALLDVQLLAKIYLFLANENRM